MTASRMCAVLGSLALVVGVAGCGGHENLDSKDEKPVQPTGGSAATPTTQVTVADFKFTPATITVSRGARVTWVNQDDAAHTATAEDRSFETGAIGQDKRKALTLDKPGTITYVCDFHPFMKGTVVVK